MTSEPHSLFYLHKQISLIPSPQNNYTHHKGDKTPEFSIRLSMAVSLTPLGLAYATIADQVKERKLAPTKQSLVLLCQGSDYQHRRFIAQKQHVNIHILNRRDAIRLIGLATGLCNDLSLMYDARGAGLPPQENAKLCDTTCEKELENAPMVTTESGLQYKDIKIGDGPSPPIGFQVAANYVAMVPSGQVFDSSLDKGRPYIFRVGSGQLAFPKGLVSAPGRPRVAPSSPVIFDVSLEFIPGLEIEEE